MFKLYSGDTLKFIKNDNSLLGVYRLSQYGDLMYSINMTNVENPYLDDRVDVEEEEGARDFIEYGTLFNPSFHGIVQLRRNRQSCWEIITDVEEYIRNLESTSESDKSEKDIETTD